VICLRGCRRRAGQKPHGNGQQTEKKEAAEEGNLPAVEHPCTFHHNFESIDDAPIARAHGLPFDKWVQGREANRCRHKE
jgi:hypothetical protein